MPTIEPSGAWYEKHEGGVYGDLKWEYLEDWDGQEWIRYSPHGSLEVDGIGYYWRGTCHARPMVELTDDDDGGRQARMRWDQPPTEEELDRWVRTGFEPTPPRSQPLARVVPPVPAFTFDDGEFSVDVRSWRQVGHTVDDSEAARPRSVRQ